MEKLSPLFEEALNDRTGEIFLKLGRKINELTGEEFAEAGVSTNGCNFRFAHVASSLALQTPRHRKQGRLAVSKDDGGCCGDNLRATDHIRDQLRKKLMAQMKASAMLSLGSVSKEKA